MQTTICLVYVTFSSYQVKSKMQATISLIYVILSPNQVKRKMKTTIQKLKLETAI